jgi:serine/threonine protein kinase
MDPDVTRQISKPVAVLYQCTCGEQTVLDPSIGGECSNCHQTVSPKLLGHELGMTLALDDGSFHLDQTTPGGNISDATGSTFLAAEAAQDAPGVLNGEMFGHFKIISPLGRGGMGQVYLALDTSLQRYVAVKILRSGIAGSSTPARSSSHEVDKLLQEAISQARVTHPNIVTIYYVGKQDGNPFLAMELVNGKPLSQAVDSGEMPFDRIAPVALDITNALKFSYDLDIIHGDIKPSNVLLTNIGTAKLSDFGMARSASKDTDETIGGTPNYIAPELLTGNIPSLQSDIYALGVTFYEMTFGELPITLTGRTIPKWIEIHESSQIVFPTPWPPRLPELWKLVLEKMLAKDPQDRYQSYDQLLADIRTLQPGSTIEARLLPRLVAAGIDWATVLSLTVVLQVGIGFAAWENLRDQHPLVTLLLQAFNFLPIIAYTFLIYFWRQSIGRSLMHIRVANSFGMKPTGNEMALRSSMRMQLPWVMICLSLFRSDPADLFSVILPSLFVLSLVFLLIDFACMVAYSQSRSIHDLLTKTRVVLDTSNST